MTPVPPPLPPPRKKIIGENWRIPGSSQAGSMHIAHGQLNVPNLWVCDLAQVSSVFFQFLWLIKSWESWDTCGVNKNRLPSLDLQTLTKCILRKSRISVSDQLSWSLPYWLLKCKGASRSSSDHLAGGRANRKDANIEGDQQKYVATTHGLSANWLLSLCGFLFPQIDQLSSFL